MRGPITQDLLWGPPLPRTCGGHTGCINNSKRKVWGKRQSISCVNAMSRSNKVLVIAWSTTRLICIWTLNALCTEINQLLLCPFHLCLINILSTGKVSYLHQYVANYLNIRLIGTLSATESVIPRLSVGGWLW